MSITIHQVSRRRELKKFINFPNQLYKGCENWVPAMTIDELATLDPKKNAAFQHCRAIYFLAYKGQKIVGRIAGIINDKANASWGENTVRFGWYDVTDDLAVSKALIQAVADWGSAQGMTVIKGPLGFSDMDKEGLLVEGFENLPSITTLYNYPYYGTHLEQLGFCKDVDWTQRIMKVPDTVSERTQRFAKTIGELAQVRMLKPNSTREVKKYGKGVFDLLNRSFQVLYEYSLLNDEQIQAYINQYMPFMNKDFVAIVLNHEDEVVGFALTIPSLSKAMQKAKGKLFPFGFIHLLKGLRQRKLAELLMIGIDPRYQNKGLNALIFEHLHTNFIRQNVEWMVTNPQLETNHPSLNLFSRFDAQPYMRRRCYTAPLSKLAR
ncbi:MAG: N-acetyltransferase [Bacteroidales bacterium]|nr:N-acetyltransferase [Bacteroidales bacterium]